MTELAPELPSKVEHYCHRKMNSLKRLLLIATFGWLCSGIGHAQAPDTLFISASQVVHLRFASELKYVNLGSRDIVAKIVDGSKDFVAVKAREPFSGCTSLSCLESTGAMHTFLVAYREHPPRLEVDTRGAQMGTGSAAQYGTAGPSEVRPPSASADTSFSFSSQNLSDYATMKQELYHLGTQEYGIELRCENIFVKDDVLFLLISLKNDSAVSYELSSPRFAVESKRRTRRGLQYEKAVFPRQAYGLGTVRPSAEGRMVFTFDKIALTRGQVFRVYFYEKGGSRNLVLTLNVSDINEAKML